VNSRSWLEIAEYASLASFVAGSIAALASQQVLYAAVPLILALSLNLVNRHREGQQTRLYISSTVANVHQVVQSLHQQVQALPSEPVDLSPITQSLSELTQKTETLTRQFNARPETQAIAQVQAELQTKIDQLNQQMHDLPAPFDPGALEQRLTELERKNHSINSSDVSSLVSAVESLQSDSSLTTEALARLSSRLSALALWLDSLPTPPEPVDLSGIQLAIKDLNAKLCDLSEQFNARPETTLEKEKL